MGQFGCGYTHRQVALMNILRKLWFEHVLWTRSFIISTAADLGDLDPVTKRLLRNPRDFADVLKLFFPSQIADRFEQLLTQHLLIAADLVNAAKKGDSNAATIQRQKWYANADEISAFLNNINPYWGRREWQMLFYEHLRMTEEEAVLRLNGKYAEDIVMFDNIENQAMKMADYMFEGLIKQFSFY